MNLFNLVGAGRLAAALAITVMFAAPSSAQNRYVRMNDGRVIRTTRVTTYVHSGGVVINALPSGYVDDPYMYSNGNPVYYQQTYWHSHNRHWHNDPDGRGGHDHGGHHHDHH